jgi:uncharacterized protein (DUF58 family)
VARPSQTIAERSSAPTPEQVLDRLDFTVMRQLDGLLQGDYRTLFRGGGLDFTDLREYQPGDDTRHIDWNVTARMNSPFVRQYVEDRDLTAWFLLDQSASMAFGGDPTKAQMLTDTVVSLARLLTRNGNRVGAVLWNNQVRSVIEPRSGRNQVLRLAKEMLTSPAQDQRREIRTQTDLAHLGHAALASIRRRSLVFLISDFVSEPGWERPLAQLSQRHEVIAVRVLDPAEIELPNAGVMVMEDSETGEQLYVDTSDPEFRRRFVDAAARREEMIAGCARRARVDLHAVSTNDDLVRSIVLMAQTRKKHRR